MNKVALVVPLAAVLAVSMILTPAFASTFNDPNEAAVADNFDIKGAGMGDDGNPYIKVYGTPGGTTSSTPGLVYVYAVVTDAGTFVATSHGGIEDSTEVGNDQAYHVHKILGINGGTNACTDAGYAAELTVSETGDARLTANKVIFENTGASSLSGASTFQLVLTIVNDGTNHVCIVSSAGFDST